MNAPVRLADTHEQARLRAEDFLLLADHGTFDDHAKTELIDGIIYTMNAQYSRHARTKTRLIVALAERLKEVGSELEVVSEVSVRVARDSVPEPDIVLTRFQGEREMPADTVALVIEVADTTLPTDLGRKVALYAVAGIPEYWVIDLDGGRVVKHHRPRQDGYEVCDEVALGQRLVSATLGWLQVETAGLLG